MVRAGAAVLLLAAAPATAPGALPGSLGQTLRWTAPEAALDALTRQPAACLTHKPGDGARVAAGEALFNSPALLGGQAAKLGISCATCHVNGRGNPHFQMPGLSQAPGTADVTTSFFNPVRGNARFDPVPIPDLAAPGKISRDAAAKALEPFISAQLTEEFAAASPSPALLASLAAYVRAIGRCAGSADAPQDWRLGDQLRLLDAALTGAAAADAGADRRAHIAAARHQLGLIADRYAGPDFARERQYLVAASRRLAGLADDPAFALGLARWRSDFAARAAPRLIGGEARSLYNRRNPALVALQRKSG